MIEFKKNYKKLLPYDRRQYLCYLGDEINPSIEWYGVSFQLPGGFEGREIGLKEYLAAYETWFKNLIVQFGRESSWIVNHDDKDCEWFPNNEKNLTSLRSLFKENNIPNTFKGALIFTKEYLVKFSRDLIKYPTAVFNKKGLLYRDLDISHSELPFIIKIFHHRDIHLLSTDKALLTRVVKENRTSLFIVREYRGTSLR
jgi:hypothetical protein